MIFQDVNDLLKDGSFLTDSIFLLLGTFLQFKFLYRKIDLDRPDIH